MGRELAAVSPVFAARLAECGRALAPYVEWSLEEVLAGRQGAPGFDRVDVVQPALWAVMVSLAAVWQAAGVEPDAVLGHSQGEIAAAVVAGILSLEDAAQVVALRSRALLALSGRGGMMSVAESVAAVEQRMARLGLQPDRASVAAVNGPAATVLSGEPAALDALLADCEGEGVRARILPVDYASHGPQVDAIREEVLRLLAGVAPKPAAIPMVSALTGELLDGTELDAGYWYASLRATVEFSRAVEVLDRSGHGVFLEASAHPVLTSSIAATLEQLAGGGESGLSRPAPLVSGTLRRDDGGPARLLASLAEAHVGGVAVDWTAVVPRAELVELPTYAFQRQRYWPKPVPAPGRRRRSGSAAEARFWSAVEAGDLDGLSRALSVDGTALGELVPALASWRRRERDESVTADWRYRVSWKPLRDPAPVTLTGTWLVITGAGAAGGELASACARALDERGARVLLAEAAPGEVTRAGLAGTVGEALAAPPTPGPRSPHWRACSRCSGWTSRRWPTGRWCHRRGRDPGTAPGPRRHRAHRAAVGAHPGRGQHRRRRRPRQSGAGAAVGLGRTAGVEHPNRWAVWWTCRRCWTTVRRPGWPGCSPTAPRTRSRSAPSASSPAAWSRRRPQGRRRRLDARGTVLLTGASGAIGPTWPPGWPTPGSRTRCWPAVAARPRPVPRCWPRCSPSPARR
ncbi:acyltransferase domain-containing protein [Streptacidiphilus sp. 4-A2]|nr:acyltransferase domain-containing protein [Streptacidiphilus sp. 4-A2]